MTEDKGVDVDTDRSRRKKSRQKVGEGQDIYTHPFRCVTTYFFPMRGRTSTACSEAQTQKGIMSGITPTYSNYAAFLAKFTLLLRRLCAAGIF